jgi:hypothetical protein
MAASVAGITADANILVNYARQAAQKYQLAYQEPIPAEQLVRTVCDLKQGYTQFGGAHAFRPCHCLSVSARVRAQLTLGLAGAGGTARAASVRRVIPVCGLGPPPRLPAVPLGPVRQLRRLARDMHWRQ